MATKQEADAFAQRVEAVGVDALRRAGSLKWTGTAPVQADTTPVQADTVPTLGAWVAEMDFGLAPCVRAALADALDADLTGYVPTAAGEDLVSAVCGYLSGQYGWNVAPDRVQLAPDVLAVLANLLGLWTPPGAPVIVPTPAYMPFVVLPRTYGHPIIEVPMRHDAAGWTLDLDDLDAAFAAGGRVLILCNPHNPIGKVYTRAELTGIAEVVERHAGQVFADEIHAPLIYDRLASPHIPYASLDESVAARTLTAFSASKAFNLPGLKCAQYVLTNPDQIALARMHPLDQGAGTLGVLAGIAAYRDGWGWLDQVIGYLDGNRHLLADLVDDLLPGVAMDLPAATYLAWLDVRALGLGDDPARFFEQRAGVRLNDGAACGKAGRGFVRLNFATPRPVLTQIVEAMAAALG